MTNCLFYSLFFALFLNISLGSLRYSQVHRVVMSAYKGMFEASVVTVDSKGESTTPYFDKTTLTSYVTKYLDKNLSKYVTDYKVTTKLLKQNNSICALSCTRVSLTTKAKINTFLTYESTQVFTIKSDGQV